MKGHIRKRKSGSWELIFDVGYEIDAETGERKRKQEFVTVQGTKRDAERRLRELLGNVDKNDYVKPDTITYGEWLDRWFKMAIAGKKKRRTEETYESVIQKHIKPALGALPLQKLSAVVIEGYFASKKLSPGTLQQHSSIIHSSLASAERKRLVNRNEAKLVDGKPRREVGNDDVRANCWEAEDAKRFLEVAKDAGPQQAALYTLAIETGMRKGEIFGLRWQDVDLDASSVTVRQQLIRAGKEPVFGPPKGGKARTIDISEELVALLVKHKQNQAEIKMRNRRTYHDHGLVFAKESSALRAKRDVLGDPIQQNNVGQRGFAELVKKAGVRPIRFHGLRHTSATLALRADIDPKVVQARLGHKKFSTTMDIYAHALPSMQKEAASKMASLLK